MWCLVFATLVCGAFSQASACDEFPVEETSNQFKQCTSEIHLQTEFGNCTSFQSFLECSSFLEPCFSAEDAEAKALDYLKEALNVVTDEDFQKVVLSSCAGVSSEGRSKRSPKRGGGGGRSSGGSRGSSSRSSSTRSRVTSAVKKVFGSGGKSSRPKVSKPKSKSKLKKFGKYAVAGLAAYGAYKLAKKMSKGLRRQYDDDDCWEYSPFQDQYQCRCGGECNIYVGSAAALASKWTVVSLTSLVLLVSNRFLI